MAERMTNVEVDDILSSIRRLVAEEVRAPLVRMPAKLVLTDAQRIDAAATETPAEAALSARIAELEALLRLPAAAAPLVPEAAAPAPPAPEAAPAPAPDLSPEHPAPPPPRATAPPPPQPPEAPEADEWDEAGGNERPPRDADTAEVIDEEVLREMLRDILREELQGALGERITRNVRKLVRAEIARAFAARDL